MSKASGLVLIFSGLAVAAYIVPQSDTGEPGALGQWTEVAKSPVAEVRASAPAPAIVAPEPRPAIRPAAPASARAAEAVPAFSAPVVVTIAQRPETSASPSPRVAVPRDREALARELQKELRRVGCYDGELNGAWTPLTRRAMKAFTDRINATLPVDEPDPILFALVQGQQDKVCGKPCPAGQAWSEEGRCLPAAILAKATKKAAPPASEVTAARVSPTPAITGWSTTSTAAAPAPILSPPVAAAAPPEGRMALAGPATEPAPATATPLGAIPPVAPAPRIVKTAPPRGDVGWARKTLARQFFEPQN